MNVVHEWIKRFYFKMMQSFETSNKTFTRYREFNMIDSTQSSPTGLIQTVLEQRIASKNKTSGDAYILLCGIVSVKRSEK